MAVSKKTIKFPKDFHSKERIRESYEPDSFYTLNPSWRFSLCDSSHWNLFADKDLFFNEVLSRIKELEKQTWSEILISGKKQNHSIPTNELNKIARDRMQELHFEYDLVYSLRVTGSHRLYGVIDHGAYYILWYDIDHGDNETCVCKSRLRHT